MTTSVRRVRRIIRKIDPWTVLKVSFIFYAVTALAAVLGAVILWSIIVARGIPQEIDGILQQIAILEEGETFFQSGEEYFRLAVFMSVVGAVVMTGLTTLAAVMYNLIADVVGGVEMVVLEESLNVPAAAPRAVNQRRTTAATTTTAAAAVTPRASERREIADVPTQQTSRVG